MTTLTVILVILIIGLGLYLFMYGERMLDDARRIPSPLSPDMLSAFEAGQKRDKVLKRIFGRIWSTVGIFYVFWGLSRVVFALQTHQLLGWLSVVTIFIGGCLMYFGGDKPSGGTGFNFRLPALKQIVGAVLCISGIMFLIGLSIGQ